MHLLNVVYPALSRQCNLSLSGCLALGISCFLIVFFLLGWFNLLHAPTSNRLWLDRFSLLIAQLQASYRLASSKPKCLCRAYPIKITPRTLASASHHLTMEFRAGNDST